MNSLPQAPLKETLSWKYASRRNPDSGAERGGVGWGRLTDDGLVVILSFP